MCELPSGLPQGDENRASVVFAATGCRQNTWQREGEGDDRERQSSGRPGGYLTKGRSRELVLMRLHVHVYVLMKEK